jgi:hypothetical protein
MVIQNHELSKEKLGFSDSLTFSFLNGWLFCRENFFAATSSVKAKLGRGVQVPPSQSGISDFRWQDTDTIERVCTVKNFSINT